MQQFTGKEYLQIDLANQYGLDKASWEDRLDWVKSNEGDLESLVPQDPKTKFLYIKALHTYRNLDKPTGFIMALDSTNSGVQIMAALGKCRKSALTCNLVNTGRREDLYGYILSKVAAAGITRQQVKEAIIPMLYGSKAAPKKLFEGEKLDKFNQAVEDTIPILGEMQALTKNCWNNKSLYHKFTMPDGHVVVLPTLVDQMTRLEIVGTSFTYHWQEPGMDDNSTPLLANIIHATDGYVAREMIRRCEFEIAHIHDSFWCSPNNMNMVRQHYVDILVEIAKSNLLESILSQLKDKPVKLSFTDKDLWQEIKHSEYTLS